MRDRRVLVLVVAAALAGGFIGYRWGWLHGYAEGLWDAAVADPAVGVA